MNTAAMKRSDQGTAFENGYRTDRGPVRVADLRGTWREMGRQYGFLLQSELRDIVSFVDGILSAGSGNRQAALKIRDSLSARMSFPLRAFFAGAAETSGLSVEQLYSANAVEYIAGLPACSAIAVWGDYAADRLVFGRNYDYGESFLRLNRDVVITVFHPADGSLSAAIAGYAGEIYAVNGFNEAGLFLELNNGTPSTGVAADPDRICGTAGLFDVLFRADSLDLLDRFFATTLCDDSYIINAADGHTARSYEWCRSGMKRADRLGPDGLLISTNHYVHPEWSFPLPDDRHSWNSLLRRENLLRLAEAGKGRFDPDRMCDLLDLPLENGGATDAFTVYQIVTEPETLALRLKITGACDWTPVDLGSFLRAK